MCQQEKYIKKIEDGIDLKGYMMWAPIDIISSSTGEMKKRYGLIYIDKDDNLKLLDYKTDYVEPGNEQELVKKYSKQLELYKEALEEALNKKVEKVYIYSVYLEKTIEI